MGTWGTVYKGHDNTINFMLREDGADYDLSSVTTITLTIGTTLFSSTNQPSDELRWQQSGYSRGEVRAALGGTSITAGTYNAYLIVYSSTYTTGLVWGTGTIRIVDEVEASP